MSEWMLQAAGSLRQFREEAQFYLRPSLDEDKFPGERTVELSSKLKE
jgi:hypothetical protein